jgi:hypothetical protein
MPSEESPDPRRMLLETLLLKVSEDRYPSNSMLDLIEHLMQPDELPEYVAMLLERIESETYPSIPLLRRLTALV